MTNNKQKIKKFFTTINIFILVAVVAFLGKYCWDYMQVRQEWESQKIRLEQVKTEIKQIQDSIDTYKAETEEFQKYLFADQDIPKFLDSISGYAKDTDINILDMKTNRFQQVVRSGGTRGGRSRYSNKEEEAMNLQKMLTLAALPIDIKIQGDFESLLGFFFRIEGFEQLLTINEVKIVSGKDYPTLRCDFTLKIYSLKTMEELSQ